MILKISVGHEIRTIEHVRSVTVLQEFDAPEGTHITLDSTVSQEGLAINIKEVHDG